MEPMHRQLGLTDEELDVIVELLGRSPSDLELAMYSVMWSEHCSYKSSRMYLKRFPTEAPWVLVGPGEGAGVIDVGDDLAVAVRIESHNHPSAVEPYEGAATGVGGIIRDIFSMGARPIALLDSLRFGSLTDPRTRFLFEGVVSGISGYGNAVGVPTVGGEVVFDDCYRGNPLVNVMCLGLLPKSRLVLAKAEGVGNLAVLIGSSTGRDGIGGASVLASAGFQEGSESKRPTVQVGDPFEEKKLIEVCLALLDQGLALGVQDLGAAGLSCAASEIAAKGGVGMDVDVARVAQREPAMNPVEVLTSESQERMLAIVTPANLDAVLELCRRFEVLASVVGLVTDTGRFRVYEGVFDAIGVPGANPASPNGCTAGVSSPDAVAIADVPVASLGDGPTYARAVARPTSQDMLNADDPWRVLSQEFPDGVDLSKELLAVLSRPTIADKTWVSRQYDHQLFLNTVVGPGSDASVLRIKGTSRGLALAVDGKARFARLDPRTGGRLVVMEAARNVMTSGARVVAAVNCLNFGNPEHPEVMWQFSEVVEGISEACEALGLPVVGGNVSFYNESSGADIDPTPVVGVIGIVEDLVNPPPPACLRDGDSLVLVGTTDNELGGSEWAIMHNQHGGIPPAGDLERAVALQRFLAEIGSRGRLGEPNGVHDCADGGLAVAIAEMAIAGEIGVRLDAGAFRALPTAAAFFSESASRVLLSLPEEAVEGALAFAAETGIPAAVIGRAGGERIVAPGALDVALAEVAEAFRGGLEDALRVGDRRG